MFHQEPRKTLNDPATLGLATLLWVALVAGGLILAMSPVEPEAAPDCQLRWRGERLHCDTDAGDRRFPAHISLALGLPIDVNAANRDQLMSIRGIGRRRAMAIEATRSDRGGFCALDDLTAVRGIGVKTLSRLAPHLRIDPSTRPARCDR